MKQFNEENDSLFKPFEITSICREDLESEGYYSVNIPDHMMKKLASKIHDAIMDTYWEVVHSYCRSNGIKSKADICEEAMKIMQEKYTDVELEYENNDDEVFYLKDQYQDEYNSLVDYLENEYLSKPIK